MNGPVILRPADISRNVREACEFLEQQVRDECRAKLDEFIQNTLVPHARARWLALAASLSARIEVHSDPTRMRQELVLVFDAKEEPGT